MNGVYDGAIVLMHANDITAGVLPRMLEALKLQGYEFVTVSELFARRNIQPEFEAYKDAKPAN
jgi:peptidoglycan/xylan/chitin deacetylase (PgdA/CDA1 family)